MQRQRPNCYRSGHPLDTYGSHQGCTGPGSCCIWRRGHLVPGQWDHCRHPCSHHRVLWTIGCPHRCQKLPHVCILRHGPGRYVGAETPARTCDAVHQRLSHTILIAAVFWNARICSIPGVWASASMFMLLNIRMQLPERHSAMPYSVASA